MTVAGPLLLSSAFNEFRPLGVMGQPVHLNHGKIVAAIRARLGDDFTHYLARPEIDDSNRKIHWHAPVEGEVRRWSDLSGAEREATTPRVTEMRDGFLSFVNDLEGRDSGNRSDQGFAHLLRQSLKSPGQETLYLVGDQPVLTLWGFEGDGTPFDTLSFAAVGGALPVVAPVAATAGVTVLPPATAAVSRPWWRWLLWWLLFLLLLALLFWLLRSCGHLPEDIPFIDDNKPVEEQPLDPAQPDVRVNPDGTVTGPDGEAVVVPPAGGATGDLPPAEGQQPVDPAVTEPEKPGDMATDPAVTEPPKPEGNTTDPDAPLDQPAAPEQPAEPETAPEDPPKPDATEEPPTPETPEEQAKPEDQTQEPSAPEQDQPQDKPADPPPADAPSPEEDGKPLEIPPAQSPEAGNGGVGFMHGEWKSDGGLVDETSGKPLDQRYRFDDKGEGEVIIRQGDGTQCRGGAKASRSADGGLRITETGPLACGDGSSYAPSVTECKPSASGKTICTGVNPDGSTYSVEVTK
tara:strand:- start:3036 stop:4589 length:1554 start_codon:yes stop_codon:yes gene_type:complete